MSSLTGSGLLVEYQDLFTSSSTQNGMQLGGKAVTGDGREYRFVLAGGTTLVPGKVQQSAAETTGWENLAVAASAIGANTIVTTTTITATAGQLSNGYAAITITPGQGYLYQISTNTAATSAVSTITLTDPIQVALTTSSKVDLILNPFSNVIVNPSTASGSVVGVAIYPVVNAQYGWVQTGGPTNVLADGAIVVGENVGASAAVAGAVKATAGVVVDVGYAMEGISDTEYGFVYLNIS